jgi:hypothetical protein
LLKTIFAVTLNYQKTKNIKNMKKTIILVWLLLAMVHTVFAEQREVYMEFHRTANPEDTRDVNRAPMRFSIEVVYDSDSHQIEVVGNDSLEAEVFLYYTNGTLVNYSSTLNTNFTVLTSGIYVIIIKGDEWYAEGEIKV